MNSLLNDVKQIPQSWSIKLPASERFVVLADFNNEAVLDKERGLVWQRELANTASEWDVALNYCHTELNLGGRKGWHLPTIEQLASLVDTSSTGSVKLPDGHPFINVQPVPYWSASTMMFENNPHLAWRVYFSYGDVTGSLKSYTFSARCVRGGS